MLRAVWLGIGGFTLGLTILLAVLRQQPTPDLPPVGVIFDGADTQIYRVNWWGRGFTQLSTGLTSAWHPHLSPTGHLIFSGEKNGIFNLYQDNSSTILTPRPLATLNSFSTADSIFFASPVHDAGVYRLKDGKLTTMVQGRIIGLTHHQQKLIIALADNGNSEIYTMDTNEPKLVNLTQHPAWDMQPQVSPDGEWLYFTSDRTGDWEVFKMRMDGGDPINLTENFEVDSDPNISPDGEWLLFQATRRSNTDIYRLHLADGEIRNLTQNPALDESARFSADGNWIVFISSRDGMWGLYRMDFEGKHLKRLSSNIRDSHAHFEILAGQQRPWRAWLSLIGGVACFYMGIIRRKMLP